MIGEKLGHYFDRPLGPLARRVGLHPNIITVVGFLVTAAAALALTRDLVLGGVLMLLGGFFDMLDGAVARASGRATAFGAFLDSVLDRYSDALLFSGLAWHLWRAGEGRGALLSMGALLGALLISYTRARAEGLGKGCKVGLMERPERIALLAFATLTGWVAPVLWAMFFLTHLTVLQRVLYVRKALKQA